MDIESLLKETRRSIKLGHTEAAKRQAHRAYSFAESTNHEKLPEATFLYASAFYISGNLDVAREYYNKALERSDLKGDSLLFAEVLMKYGLAKIRLRNFVDGEQNITQATRILSDLANDTLAILAHQYLGISKYYQSEFESAKKHLFNSLRLAIRLQKAKEASDNHNLLAQTYSEINQYDSAVYHQEKSVQIQKELGHERYLNEYYKNLHYLHIQFGKLGALIEGLIQHFKALEETGLLLDKESIEPQIYINEELRLLHEEQQWWKHFWQVTSVIGFLGMFIATFLLLRFRLRYKKQTSQVSTFQEQITRAESIDSLMQMKAALKEYNGYMRQLLAVETTKPLSSCLELLSYGLTDNDIARHMGKQPNTVTKYLLTIADTLGMSSTELRKVIPRLGGIIRNSEHES